jgi:hypothetical protein
VLVAEDQTGLAGDLTRFAETFSDLADPDVIVTGYRRRVLRCRAALMMRSARSSPSPDGG